MALKCLLGTNIATLARVTSGFCRMSKMNLLWHIIRTSSTTFNRKIAPERHSHPDTSPFPTGTATEKVKDSFECSTPRKSLVKGERFVRSEVKPECDEYFLSSDPCSPELALRSPSNASQLRMKSQANKKSSFSWLVSPADSIPLNILRTC